MEHPGQQVVVLSKVFAADINTGYQDLCNVQVSGSLFGLVAWAVLG